MLTLTFDTKLCMWSFSGDGAKSEKHKYWGLLTVCGTSHSLRQRSSHKPCSSSTTAMSRVKLKRKTKETMQTTQTCATGGVGVLTILWSIKRIRAFRKLTSVGTARPVKKIYALRKAGGVGIDIHEFGKKAHFTMFHFPLFENCLIKTVIWTYNRRSKPERFINITHSHSKMNDLLVNY